MYQLFLQFLNYRIAFSPQGRKGFTINPAGASKEAYHTLNKQVPEDLQPSVWDASFQGLQVAIVQTGIPQLNNERHASFMICLSLLKTQLTQELASAQVAKFQLTHCYLRQFAHYLQSKNQNVAFKICSTQTLINHSFPQMEDRERLFTLTDCSLKASMQVMLFM